MASVKRILVVGAGIGGLSTAAALQKVGFDVAVLEQSPELREVGAGVGLWSNALHSLQQLGAGDAVVHGCLPIRVLAAANARGRNLSFHHLDELGPEFASAACFIVLRPVLLKALAQQVSPNAVRTGRRAVRVVDGPDRVLLHLDDGSVAAADLLVGADGIHSLVRPLVAGPGDIRYSGQTCFRGIANYGAETGVLREVQGAGQRGSVCAVNAGTAYWWAALNSAPGRIIPTQERKSFLLECFRGWPFGLPEAIAATSPSAIFQNDLVDRLPARAYAQGRLVLVGDAAHPATPNLGQGANMAIDDGIVLARCLRDAPSIAEALGRYQHQRIHRTTQIVERSWNFGRMCLWKSALGVAAREWAVRLTPKSAMRKILRWQILENVGSL